MNCLVTGGLGFLGSHTARRLARDGHHVRILDVRCGSEGDPENCEIIQGNLNDPASLKRALTGIEVVFHFACSLLPHESNRKPEEDLAANLAGNARLFLSAAEHGARKIVFASSGGTVYGEPRETPVPENAQTDPMSSYGIVKLASEKYLGLFERLHKLTFSALRYSNPYGEGQDPARRFGAVATFLGSVATGEPIRIWGDGSTVRDYIYIDDMVEATIRAADYTGPERVFNIGTGTGTSVSELLGIVEAVSGLKARVVYEPARASDVPVVVLDTARSRRELAWTAETSLEAGIERTWRWCKEFCLTRSGAPVR